MNARGSPRMLDALMRDQGEILELVSKGLAVPLTTVLMAENVSINGPGWPLRAKFGASE